VTMDTIHYAMLDIDTKKAMLILQQPNLQSYFPPPSDPCEPKSRNDTTHSRNPQCPAETFGAIALRRSRRCRGDRFGEVGVDI
jgi:hypothetical protein